MVCQAVGQTSFRALNTRKGLLGVPPSSSRSYCAFNLCKIARQSTSVNFSSLSRRYALLSEKLPGSGTRRNCFQTVDYIFLACSGFIFVT